MQKDIRESHIAMFIAEFMLIMAISASIVSYMDKTIIAYGDAESHLNIAKRVVHSITPGAAQLGGIWLPLPHLMLLPLVILDPLWRSGIAGSIVSGLSYIISGIFLYKLVYMLSKNHLGGILAAAVFALNPNILYLQTTPMTELPLIMFFILSTYYFSKFLLNTEDIVSLSYSAFFTLCATLSRYDGWLLSALQAGIIFLVFSKKIFKNDARRKIEGYLILFCSLAFIGILFWFMWDYLILGDPLYFTNSTFSAKSQQQGWLKKGELPAYKNLGLSALYYIVTSVVNIGNIASIIAMGGMIFYLIRAILGKENKWIPVVIMTPLIFYILTLYMGQSVIFIPQLTPKYFSWNLFNVRYGVMMVPVAAFFIGYCFARGKSTIVRAILGGVLLVGIIEPYIPPASMPISLADGVYGLSHSSTPNAEIWLKKNYDGGNVLLDDYARTLSIIRSGLPIQNVIYIGNKPYWEDSLREPEKYATWVVMQENDSVWNALYKDEGGRGRLFKYYVKAYTSPTILIFKKNTELSLK